MVRAKLVPPRLPRGSVRRPGLLDTLRAGRGRSLTLVSAPAGFGKTTLLAEWAQTDLTGRFAWVSLDAGDCEPERFWSHVAAALSGVEPRVTGATVAAMRARPRRIGDVAMPRLFDALARGDDDLVLVLDDYHRAETPEISALLAEFLRYRPERVQLVVSTRSDPALGVARLRAGGDLVEVRADALRFDEAEVASFFDGIGLAGLTPAEGHQLAERTGGWPAPLRLASLLMPERGRADVHRAVLRREPARRRLPRAGRARPARPGDPRLPAPGLGARPVHRPALRRGHGDDGLRRRPWPSSNGRTCSSRWTAQGSGTSRTSCSREALRVELTRTQPDAGAGAARAGRRVAGGRR